MVKVRIEGLPEEVEKFTEQLEKTDMSSYRKAKTIRTEIQFISENMWR